MENSNPSGNQASFFGQKVSIPGVNVNSAGDNQLILKDNYSTRLYYNAQGVPSVMIGLRIANTSNLLTANQQGFFVSQAGIDVTQATDQQLIFNSGNDTFEIVKKVFLTLTYSHVSGSEYHQTSVPHGLTYTPGFNAFNNIDPGMVTYWGLAPAVGSRPNPSSLTGTSGSFVVSLCWAEVTVDANNVYLLVQTGGGEPAATYTFSATAYLLRETFS